MSQSWTVQRIKEGFERFRNEHGRLPTCPEIDALDYLPSSRWIQLKFGGVEMLRARLGYQHSHLGRGIFRSQIANRVGKRGRDTELALEETLRNRFGDVFVHTEKTFDSSKNRVDFYVYSQDGDFGIDVFYPETLRTMENNVNIKMNKYRNFPLPLFLAVANKGLKQKDLDAYVDSKARALPDNIKIVSLNTLESLLTNKRAYPNPLLPTA